MTDKFSSSKYWAGGHRVACSAIPWHLSCRHRVYNEGHTHRLHPQPCTFSYWSTSLKKISSKNVMKIFTFSVCSKFAIKQREWISAACSPTEGCVLQKDYTFLVFPPLKTLIACEIIISGCFHMRSLNPCNSCKLCHLIPLILIVLIKLQCI